VSIRRTRRAGPRNQNSDDEGHGFGGRKHPRQWPAAFTQVEERAVLIEEERRDSAENRRQRDRNQDPYFRRHVLSDDRHGVRPGP
jgi:hypothetical protein